MHYVDQGTGNPILFVHGNPTWSFYYRNLIQSLSGRFRTIAVDHIGCGLSDKPVDYRYQLEQHIQNLVALIDDLDLKRTTLVAHDWGGAIGLGTLLERQDRFERIVLFNTGAFPPPFIPFRISVCRWPVLGKIAVQGFNAFAKAAITMATEMKAGLPRDVAAGMLHPYDDWSNRSAIYGFVQDIPMSKSHPTYAVLEKIELGLSMVADWPIQLIWGMKDWCFRPECLDRFVSHWPNANVTRIPDAGHYVVEDAADEVGDMVSKFLEGG